MRMTRMVVGAIATNCYIVSDESCTPEGEDGIFVAGDCRTKSVRQVATAVSDGAVAAINACRYLDTI